MFPIVTGLYWLQGGVTMRAIMKQGLRQALSLRQKRHAVAADRVSAVVLLHIYYKQGQYYILFTAILERTTRLCLSHG